MVRFLRPVCIAAAVVLISSCASSPAKQDRVEMPEITAPKPVSAAEICAAKGGSYGPAGLLGANRCTLPYSDAGAVCTDSLQCEGQCLAGQYDAAGYSGEGTCQANDNPFGCRSEIIGGEIQPGLCVD